MRYGYLLEDTMLIVILQSPFLKRVVLLGAVGKNVSVDIAFSYEATVSFGCSFSSDSFLYFRRVGYGLFRNPKIPPILQKKRTKNNLFNRTEDS